MNTQIVIGKFIAHSYANNKASLKEVGLFNEIENLIDIISNRVKEKGIEYTANSVLEDVFKIKLMILSKTEMLDTILNKTPGLIVKEITNKLEPHKKQNVLDSVFADSLELYLKVFSQTSNNISSIGLNLTDFSNAISQIPNYNSFLNIISLIPIPSAEKEIIAAQLRAALLFETYLLLHELIEINKNSLTINENQLATLMLSNAEDFGFYSAKLGIWHPDKDDETQIVRNIKIRLSVSELLEEEHKGYSLTQLKDNFFN